MAYEIGQMVRLPVTVTDSAGVPTDATMAIQVTKPDGTLVTPAPNVVDDPGTGSYHADVVADAAGPWLWRYTASGALVGVQTGQFFVRLPGVAIISLREAKEHLNKDLTITTDDDEVRDHVDITRWVLERECGPIVPRDLVEFYNGPRGRGHKLFLRQRPVISVSEVRETWAPGDTRILTPEPDGGVGATINDYLLDARLGTLERRSNGFTYWWPSGSQCIRVSYRVGRDIDRYRAAALALLAHLWRTTQLVSGRSRAQGGDAADVFAPTYSLPNRVREMLPGRRAPRLGGW